jgi:hypothetical protein
MIQIMTRHAAFDWKQTHNLKEHENNKNEKTHHKKYKMKKTEISKLRFVVCFCVVSIASCCFFFVSFFPRKNASFGQPEIIWDGIGELFMAQVAYKKSALENFRVDSVDSNGLH